MAARTSLLSKRHSHTRATSSDLRGMLHRASMVVWRRLVVTAASRRTRARLGMLGVPLAMTAGLVAGLWWTVLPLALCAWWWAPRHKGWEWIGAVGRGLIGAEWAFIGSSAIATFPHDSFLVGVFWSLGAGLLGLFGSGMTGQSNRSLWERGRQGNAVQLRRNSAPAVRRRFAMHLAVQRTQGAAKKQR
jgi:hypothetical protein